MAEPAEPVDPDELLTAIELAHLIRGIDDRVLRALYIKLRISPELTYDDKGHVKTVTLNWNQFMQLATPWLKDA